MNKIWWTKTDGASRFLTEAANLLNEGRSVIFCLPKRVPWLETMREVLHDLLSKRFSGVREIETLDASQILKSPPKYVMKNFCPNKDGFRPYSNEAYAEFLANSPSNLLLERCLWIQNADETQAPEWFSFIADYHRFLSGKRGGSFILEMTSDLKTPQPSAGVEVFSYADRITEYDCFAFHIMAAGEYCKANRLMKQYLAEMVTKLVGGDLELGAACLRRAEEFLREPREIFKSVSAEEKRTHSEEDIDFAVWFTQLKLTFPLIETFRRNLIKRYHDAIAKALPYDTDYGERIYQPKQAELGVLCRLASEYRMRFDKPDWDELLYYRDVRNTVAHLGILSFEELQTLFDKNPRR